MTNKSQTTVWKVSSVGDGLSGRGDWEAKALRDALDDGWEPFSVSGGRIWLRRMECRNS